MNKGLKIFLWILAIIIVLAVMGYFLSKTILDNVIFSKPIPQGLDLKGLTLGDLANIALAGEQKTVTVTVGMNITNNNSFAIPFSNVKAQLYYKGVLIGETNDPDSHTIPASGSAQFTDTVNIILNNAGGNLLIEKLKGGKPQLDYVIGLRVFGIPIPSVKDTLIWE